MNILKKPTQLAAWVSQGINVITPGGHENQTLSARCYRNRDRGHGWYVAYRTLNIIFFLQEDHCKSSYMTDYRWSKELLDAHDKQ